MYQVFILLQTVFVIVLYYHFHQRSPISDENSTTRLVQQPLPSAVPHHIHLPVRRDGVIFITNAAKGPVREAAMELARQGYHVVIGAKSKAEQRSFAYMNTKGIEVLSFDLYDPSTYPDVIYRLRNIRKSLDRPVVGLMLNIADYIYEEAVQHPVDAMLDVDYVNNEYRMILKSPVRFTQAILELVKLQQHGELDAFTMDRNQTLLPDHERKQQEKAEQKRIKSLQKQLQKEIHSWNSGGLRINILFTQVNSSNAEIMQQCGLVCVLQQSVMDYYQLLSTVSFMKNFSVSLIPTRSLTAEDFIKPDTAEDVIGMDYFGGSTPSSSSAKDKKKKKNDANSVETLFVNDIKWALDEEQQEPGEGSTGKKGRKQGSSSRHGDIPTVSKEAKAIMHSFLSQNPLFYYDPNDIRNTYSVSHRRYVKGGKQQHRQSRKGNEL